MSRTTKVRAKYSKGEVTLQKIRAAAIDEITEKGYHRTSICDIVRRAELTRGAFYNYWNSMDDCLTDLLISIKDQPQDLPLPDLIKELYHPSATVMRVIGLLVLVVKCDWRAGFLPLTLLQEKRLPGTELKESLILFVEGVKQEWTALIEKDKSEGVIRADVDSEELAMAIMNMTGSLLHLSQTTYEQYRAYSKPTEIIFLRHLESVLEKSVLRDYTIQSLIPELDEQSVVANSSSRKNGMAIV